MPPGAPHRCRTDADLRAHAFVATASACFDAATDAWYRAVGEDGPERLIDEAVTAVRSQGTSFARDTYRRHNAVERCFCARKNFRSIVNRHDKTAADGAGCGERDV
ncbi:hypothetical protein ABZY93_31755 [Streptomyces smyrnaeus]|uniref:hypothetical protein n=1 Tax=Streptomyces smyrnaeus TaxID=1387713 RepID=UPI00339DFA71